jgi:hypothetical protein
LNAYPSTRHLRQAPILNSARPNPGRVRGVENFPATWFMVFRSIWIHSWLQQYFRAMGGRRFLSAGCWGTDVIVRGKFQVRDFIWHLLRTPISCIDRTSCQLGAGSYIPGLLFIPSPSISPPYHQTCNGAVVGVDCSCTMSRGLPLITTLKSTSIRTCVP